MQDEVDSIYLFAVLRESGIDRDKICGTWTSVEGRPDVLVYKEGECYS